VLRCHFDPSGKPKLKMEDIPTLPYPLLQAKECADLWCFGVVLFTLCSGGRQLFTTNIKNGHLHDMSVMFGWNDDAAAAKIYEHVHSEVAQDLLLQLLSPYERRMTLTIRDILDHPFFTSREANHALVEKIITKHQAAKTAYVRRRDLSFREKSRRDWLKKRTDMVHCWNFDLLRSIHFSPSETIRALTGMDNTLPSSFLILPYLLSAKNKKGKLAPTTKRDVERAERMGVLLLLLSKACHFGACVEGILKSSIGRQKWDSIALVDSLSFDSNSFEGLKEEFSKIAAEQVEAFRSDPMTAVKTLIGKRYLEIRSFFKDAGKAFLYLVDEYEGIPLVGPSYDPYPIELSETTVDKILPRVLPFMHASSMIFRGIAGNLSGIVKLIFEAAFPHTPGSWAAAASGLPNILDESIVQTEVTVLQQTLSGLEGSATTRSLQEHLEFLHGTCTKADVVSNYGGMRRVKCADSCLWTAPAGSIKIQEACRDYDFREALSIQAALESKLKQQEQVIRDLQDKVEFLGFRKQLNLSMPGDQSSSSHSAFPVSIQPSSSSGSRTIKVDNQACTPVSKSEPSQVEDMNAELKTATTASDEASKKIPLSVSYTPDETNKAIYELEVQDSIAVDDSSVATDNTKSTLQDNISVD
jgi:hypothetical protein